MTTCRGSDLDGVHDLVRELDLERFHARERERICEIEFFVAHKPDHDIVLASELAYGLFRDLDFALVVARDLVNVLALARACDLVNVLTLVLTRNAARSHNVALIRYVGGELVEDAVAELVPRAADIVKALRALERDPAPKGSSRSPATVVVSWTARRVVGVAARLLPVEHWPGKAEEFAGELFEIAAAAGSRRRQLAHALRVLVYVVPLRRALSGSRRRPVDRG